MKNALIIFVRNPELGKVKTRLAAQIGNELALKIYMKLLQHTKLVASEVKADKFVFSSETLSEDWPGYTVKYQSGVTLGDKMKHAFEYLFTRGYSKVVIIGSDCPGLTASHINEAFLSMENYDISLGPAQDGGYYLLGMKKMHLEIFDGKSWSSAKLFKETINTLDDLNLTYNILETLIDVDEEQDIPEGW